MADKPFVFWLILIRIITFFSLLSADNVLSPKYAVQVPQNPIYNQKVLDPSSRLCRIQQSLEAEVTTPITLDCPSPTLEIFSAPNHRHHFIIFHLYMTGRNGICDCSTRVEHAMAWAYAQVDEGAGLLPGWLNISFFKYMSWTDPNSCLRHIVCISLSLSLSLSLCLCLCITH